MRRLSRAPFRDVFRRGSRTYFNSSLFFPRPVREDVFVLYAFVRTADDFVDRVPQDADGFAAFREEYEGVRGGRPAASPVIARFAELAIRRRFEDPWIDLFLEAMAADLTKRTYETLEETQAYMAGSAEVIGRMMARIMDLPDASLSAAALLGRSMQYINFIRDIDEDEGLGRRYLPRAEALRFGLQGWGKDAAGREPEAFVAFIRAQIALYEGWQAEAEAGYRFLPRRFRVPVAAAADMYVWTSQRIRRDPFIVFREKVKPSKARVLAAVARRALMR